MLLSLSDVPGPETDELRITWKKLPGPGSGIVEGRVVDSQGRPLSDVGVGVMTDSGGNGERHDDNGEFRITGVSGEFLEVEVRVAETRLFCSLAPISELGVSTNVRMEIIVKGK